MEAVGRRPPKVSLRGLRGGTGVRSRLKIGQSCEFKSRRPDQVSFGETMATLAAQSAGGRATAVILKVAALQRYITNPRICSNCNMPIQAREGQDFTEVR